MLIFKILSNNGGMQTSIMHCTYNCTILYEFGKLYGILVQHELMVKENCINMVKCTCICYFS